MFQSQPNSFSMLFSVPNQNQYNQLDDPITSSSASVDCTLSLGTPSTRHNDDDKLSSHHHHRRTGSCMSNLYWDSHSFSSPHKSSSNNNNNLAGDSLLARRCANCDTTSTPLWRNGPRGPKSLCNACGIRYKKEERRATMISTTNTGTSVMEMNHQNYHNYIDNNTWDHYPQTNKIPPSKCPVQGGNEFKFTEDENRESGIPFFSWHLNVPDRPSRLVHDYT